MVLMDLTLTVATRNSLPDYIGYLVDCVACRASSEVLGGLLKY